MKRGFRFTALLAGCSLLVSGLPAVGQQDSLPPTEASGMAEAQKREVLWKALFRAFPVSDDRQIDLYAENPSLTAVCFRSRDRTLIFSLEDKRVICVEPQKLIGNVNRITFEKGAKPGLDWWVLWNYGTRELSIGASE